MKKTLCSTLALLLTSITGCGPATPSQPTVVAPTVDARFATADALLDHYNQLISGKQVDMRGTFALYYAENKKQERIIDLLKNSFADFLELQLAILDRFGDDMPARQRDELEKQRPKPAVMSQRDTSRCQATATGPDGIQQTIRLVKIGDRWWISGYTFEYDPALEEEMRRIEDFAGMMGYLGPMSRAVRARLDAGEFDSIDEVSKAIADEAIAFAAKNQPQPQQPSGNTSLSPSG